MRKNLIKYVLLVIITFIVSILIYNYIESFKPIKTESDLLIDQKELENNYLANTNFTINNPNVILNPYGNSPLTALIVFQTNDLTTPTVTIKGKDGAKDIVHTFTPNKIHVLPIYGLYAGYENKVIISASGYNKEIVIKTDELPSDFAKIENINSNFDTDEFYFTTPEDIGYTAAYDQNGEVRWYIIGDYKWNIQRLNNGHILMSSDKVIKSNYSVGLMEMDLLGKVYFEYVIPGGYHHSVYELNNGNLLLASNNLNSDTVEDYIVEIDRNSGDIVKSFNLNKILKNKKHGNWFKISSLVYDQSTNSITVTGQNSNMLVNIDYSSANINWIIGENVDNNLKNLVLKNDGDVKFPINPKSINLLESNKMIFVNNNSLTTYQIDYSKRSFSQIDNYDLDVSEHSYLEVINENDYIITENDKIVELKDYEKVTDLKLNSKLYNSRRMPLYANDLYTGVQGIRFGSLDVSKTTNDYPILKWTNDTTVLKKYNISLNKDVFGLKVSGKFSKKDKVQIILDNVFDKKIYNLEIVNNKKTSRYISEDGINGKYYIYLNINGKVYKLFKYVYFY